MPKAVASYRKYLDLYKTAPDGKKVRKVGGRAVHADKAAAETWMSGVKTKLTSLGWKAKGTTKVDAFGIDSLPAPAKK